MEKRYRCQNEYVYTSTFVPEHSMPNKEPNALDPFLEPLVDELVELFNEGMKLRKSSQGVESHLRVGIVQMLWVFYKYFKYPC